MHHYQHDFKQLEWIVDIEVKNEVRCPLVPKFWSIPV